jgi:uncharacterized membrane protein
MYNFSLLFTYFLLYAIIGWACEVIYCSFLQKKIVNRGFLNGPYCPIYGIGAIVIVFFLAQYTNRPAEVFFVGIILTSILEYITSWGMEKLFHAKWWDYSNYKFNINGRVCLKNSLMFGLLSLVLMYIIHPFSKSILENIPPFWLEVIALISAVIFFGDVIESTRETVALNKKLSFVTETTKEFKDALKDKGIHTAQELSNKIHELKTEKFSDAKDSAQNAVEYFTTRIIEPKKLNRYSQQRILKAFPHMSHHLHPDSLEVYKASLLSKKAKKQS